MRVFPSSVPTFLFSPQRSTVPRWIHHNLREPPQFPSIGSFSIRNSESAILTGCCGGLGRHNFRLPAVIHQSFTPPSFPTPGVKPHHLLSLLPHLKVTPWKISSSEWKGIGLFRFGLSFSVYKLYEEAQLMASFYARNQSRLPIGFHHQSEKD